MKLGFHTISLLLHDEVTAAHELAKIGYQSIAVRPRNGGLDPGHDRFVERMLRWVDATQRLRLETVYDLDAWFLHNPCVQQGPMLASADSAEADEAERWIETWIKIAAEHQTKATGSREFGEQHNHPLGNLITFASGQPQRESDDSTLSVPAFDEAALERLSMRLDRLVQTAVDSQVRLAIRPASRHTIATVAHYERLKQWLDSGEHLLLAADVGEMLLGGEFPVGDRLARNTESLACVYLCEPDVDRDRDQLVGCGDVDLSRVVSALKHAGFRGPAIVRVHGHSERGLQIAREAWEFLTP